MRLLICAHLMAGLPQAIIQSIEGGNMGVITTLVILVLILCVIPFIVYLERGQRRITVQYDKRVFGRRIKGGQSTYLPIKVNTAGVIAGGAVRPLYELAGIKNILSKSLGSDNGLIVIKAAAEGLKQLSTPDYVAARRGLTFSEMFVFKKENYAWLPSHYVQVARFRQRPEHHQGRCRGSQAALQP